MECAEARRVVAARVGGRVDLDHFRELPGQPQRFGLIGLRRLIAGGLPRGNERPDDGDQHQQHQNARQDQQIFHACASCFFFLYMVYAIPMASAPEGMIIKLVDEISPGTSVKSTLITTSGAMATTMFFR